MADRFVSHQAYPDNDNSDDHLLEEGRCLEAAPPEPGGSNRAINVATTGWLLPRGGRYPAFRAQEWTGLTTSRLGLGFADS